MLNFYDINCVIGDNLISGNYYSEKGRWEQTKARLSSQFVFCNKFHTLVGFALQPFISMSDCPSSQRRTRQRHVNQLINQFSNSRWDLGRHLGSALLIAAAAVGALPNKLFVMGVPIAITVVALFMLGCLGSETVVQKMTQKIHGLLLFNSINHNVIWRISLVVLILVNAGVLCLNDLECHVSFYRLTVCDGCEVGWSVRDG